MIIGLGPNPEKNGRLMSGPPRRPDGQFGEIPHYRVEIVIGLMVFCFIGGKVTTTAYLATYVEQTGVIDSYHENYLVLGGGKKLLADIPLGRPADPPEIAETIRWLATEAPASATGAVIDVNGASYVR